MNKYIVFLKRTAASGLEGYKGSVVSLGKPVSNLKSLLKAQIRVSAQVKKNINLY